MFLYFYLKPPQTPKAMSDGTDMALGKHLETEARS